MREGLLRLPTKISNFWLQLAKWHMPDKKLRQDIASWLFMAADVLNRLSVIDDRSNPDFEEERDELPSADSHLDTRLLRADRNG